jgi:hypothetical protein
MVLVLFLIGLIAFDLLALRLGAQSRHDNRGTTWW